MRNKEKYQWQGENIHTVFGICTVYENKEKPMIWYNYECNLENPKGVACIPAIKIKYRDQEFVIANHFGIGINKLLKGGWPNATHFSLPLERFSQQKRLIEKEFDLEAYTQYEIARNNWQKETYPKEYESLEELRQLAGKQFFKK